MGDKHRHIKVFGTAATTVKDWIGPDNWILSLRPNIESCCYFWVGRIAWGLWENDGDFPLPWSVALDPRWSLNSNRFASSTVPRKMGVVQVLASDPMILIITPLTVILSILCYFAGSSTTFLPQVHTLKVRGSCICCWVIATSLTT